MAQNNKNFMDTLRPLVGRIGWLVGILLSLFVLTSCGGEETTENSDTTEIQLRPQIAESLKLAQEKKYEEATSKVFELVVKNPKDAEALAVMSYIYMKSGRLDKAAPMAKRALAIDSYMARPYVVLARAKFQRSGFQEALDLARKALIMDHKAYEAYQIIGEVYLRQGMVQDAVTVLEEAVKLDSENPELLIILGSGYIKGKQYDRALSTLMTVQEIDSKIPGAHFNLAVVYAKLKQGRKAIRHIAKAEDLYALDADNKLWLGKTRDIRRVIAREFRLRPEDIMNGTAKN